MHVRMPLRMYISTNLTKLSPPTHTVDPDHCIAVRYATFEGLANILDVILRPYMANVPGSTGADPEMPQIGAYPGTIILML